MTRLDPALRPKKIPTQARGRATFDAICEATAHILETAGPEALTTNLIAERAGVSIGSLYQYFPTKEAIVAELIRDMRRSMLDDIRTMAAYCEGQSLDFTVRRMVRAAIHHHLHGHGRAEVLEQLEERLPSDPEVEAMKREIAEISAGLLAAHGIPDPALAAFDLINLVLGMVHPAVHAGETDYEALATRVDRAALGYLGVNLLP